MAQQIITKTIVPPNSPERWGGVDPKPPPHFDEPKDPVLLEYVHGGRTAIITFNRPQAGNTVTTALGVRLSEISRRDRVESYRAVRHPDGSRTGFLPRRRPARTQSHGFGAMAEAAEGLRSDALHAA